MTHEKFIESLNLYLDGELPPHAAAELEREISGNLERRRIYRQYCQMQKACGELAERFREEASPAPQFRKGVVVEIPQRRAAGEWLRSIGLVATGAAAACAVFLAVRQHSPSKPADGVAVNQPASASVAVAAPSQPVPLTTTVALDGNPVGFRDLWAKAAVQNRTVADFSRITVPASVLTLGAPQVTFPTIDGQAAGPLQPYGVPLGAPLRSDEISSAAFQFQR
jgi:anti-sigma factor RsiW